MHICLSGLSFKSEGVFFNNLIVKKYQTLHPVNVQEHASHNPGKNEDPTRFQLNSSKCKQSPTLEKEMIKKGLFVFRRLLFCLVIVDGDRLPMLAEVT